MNCNIAWESFLKNGNLDLCKNNTTDEIKKEKDIPKCSELYISTKTKIGYLNSIINLDLFWEIPLLNFCEQKNGIIKKQIKLTLRTQNDIDILNENIKKERCVKLEKISFKQLTNDTFKDIRKISIGLSNKDLTKKRTKKKGAFYNFFVLIIRLFVNGSGYIRIENPLHNKSEKACIKF